MIQSTRPASIGCRASCRRPGFTPTSAAIAWPPTSSRSPPQFQLWSDGAGKRRFIQLPAGGVIDTSDMDDWQFPAGTKIWKEFTRAGRRIETRLLQKVGPAPGDWVPLAYLWDDDGADATAVPDGFVDARGTSHDVPAAPECLGCHGGRSSGALGFSAIQLSSSGATPAGGLDLRELVRRGWLSAPPARDFTVPGDDVTRAALGYLHANCGHCHNQARPRHDGHRCFDPERGFDLSLRVGDLDRVEATGVYRTAIGDVVRRGDVEGSKIIRRTNGRDWLRGTMPPLGTEEVDQQGSLALRRWIERL